MFLFVFIHVAIQLCKGHGGTVVKHLPPTCEVGGEKPNPHVAKLVVD